MKASFQFKAGKLMYFLIGLGVMLSAKADTSDVWSQQMGIDHPRKSFLSEVGPNSRTWTLLPDNADVATVSSKNPIGKGFRHVEELETGMNYYDGKQWVPSIPAFSLVKNALVADKVQHKVNIAVDNLNVGNAVEITLPEGGVIQSTPVAIGLYDTVSGKSQIIGQLTDCAGALVDSNQIVFENAFTGVGADVLYKIDRGSFSQDVILTSSINPEDYGFSTNAVRIQIFTEIYNDVEPDLIKRPLYIEEDENVRAQRATPDLIDYCIDVGGLFFGAGQAYIGSATKAEESGVLVAKEWVVSDGRRFLVESVDYGAIRERLETLPVLEQKNDNSDGDTKGHGSNLKIQKHNDRGIASISKARPLRNKLLASNFSLKHASAVRTGLVIDYNITLNTSTVTSRLFSSDYTYLISGTVYCSGTTTMEGGTCLKYMTNGSVVINTSGILKLKDSDYSPVVFTAVDDHSVGDTLTSSSITTNGYANPALYFNYASSSTVTNAIFRYCKKAIRVDGSVGGSNFPLTVKNSQLINCIQGVSITVGTGSSSSSGSSTVAINFYNDLIANVSPFPSLVSVFNVSGSSPTMANATFAHCTLYGVQSVGVFNIGTTIYATNCIFDNVSGIYSGSSASVVGAYNGFYTYGSNQPFGTLPVTSPNTPFQDEANLSFYLKDDSVFKSAGTTNAMTSVLSGFTNRTTSIPGYITNASENLTLNPLTLRYIKWVAPDLGYYYPVLDYIVSELSVTNGVTVNVQPGTAIGLNGGTTAFNLKNGATLSSVGTVTQPIIYAPTTLIQANPVPQRANPHTIAFCPSFDGSDSVTVPSLQLRFSNIYLGCDDYHICSGQNTIDGITTNVSPSSCVNLNVRDSILHGGKMSLGGGTISFSDPGTSFIGWTNNLFERVYVNFAPSSTLYWPLNAYNNLMYKGYCNLTPQTSDWVFHNNLFDQVIFSQNGSQTIEWDYNTFAQATASQVAAATNGWTLTSAALPTTNGTHSYYPTSVPVYYTSTFGNYYFTPSVTFYTSYLKDRGSTNAPDAGFYHYTMLTTQVKETNTVVDIGLHYVAAVSGIPSDIDSDGLPDYLDGDSDGDGIPNSLDGDPLNSAVGILTVIIDSPSQGAIITQ